MDSRNTSWTRHHKECFDHVLVFYFDQQSKLIQYPKLAQKIIENHMKNCSGGRGCNIIESKGRAIFHESF